MLRQLLLLSLPAVACGLLPDTSPAATSASGIPTAGAFAADPPRLSPAGGDELAYGWGGYGHGYGSPRYGWGYNHGWGHRPGWGHGWGYGHGWDYGHGRGWGHGHHGHHGHGHHGHGHHGHGHHGHGHHGH